MKRVLAVLSCLVLNPLIAHAEDPAPAAAPEPAAAPAPAPSNEATIKVNIEGLRSDQGAILVYLFASEDGFPDKPKKAMAQLPGAIKGGKASVEFKNIAKGKMYAVSTCHDENGNKECDTNFLGIPKEGVATSNLAHKKNMIPKFEKAKFSHDGALTEVPVSTYSY